MISAAGTMKPLPVRPIETTPAPLEAPTGSTAAARTMHPLPVPTPDRIDLLMMAIRDTAFAQPRDAR